MKYNSKKYNRKEGQWYSARWQKEINKKKNRKIKIKYSENKQKINEDANVWWNKWCTNIQLVHCKISRGRMDHSIGDFVL